MNNVQDYSFLCDNAVLQLYMGVTILLTCGAHLHDRIILLRGEIWPHKTSLTQLFFLLKCQDRNVCGHVFVCLGYQCFLFLLFRYLTLELFRFLFCFYLICVIIM
jgi:hypothetical protein